MRRAFGIEMPVRLIFDHPTPAGLAAALAPGLPAGLPPSLRRHPWRPARPLLPLRRRRQSRPPRRLPTALRSRGGRRAPCPGSPSRRRPRGRRCALSSRPGAALVHRSADAGEPALQRAARLRAGGRARPPGARPRPHRRRDPARDPARDPRPRPGGRVRRGGAGRADRPPAARRPTAGRPLGAPQRAAGGRGPLPRRRPRPRPLRPRGGAAPPRPPPRPRAAAPPAPPRPPPRRHGRMVDRRPPARAGRDSTPRRSARRPSLAPRSPLAVPRLRRLAASARSPATPSRRELAFWRDALAGAPGRARAPADRPRPESAASRGRRPPACGWRRRRRAGSRRSPAKGAGDSLHGPPCRLPDPPRADAPASRTSSSARRSRTAAGWSSSRSSASSSTPWSLRTRLDGEPDASASSSGGCARRSSAPTATRTCPFERLVEELNPERSLGRRAALPDPLRAPEHAGRERRPAGAHPRAAGRRRRAAPSST